jgi:transposase
MLLRKAYRFRICPDAPLPRTTSAGRKRLTIAQRRVARRQKGSRNRGKAKRRVAGLRARHARRGMETAHKATTTIVKNHGGVIEDLKVRDMTRTGRGSVENPARSSRNGEREPGTSRGLTRDDPDKAT